MITQEYLKSILHYDQETGVFVWKVRVSKKVRIGAEAGCNVQGRRTQYRVIGIDGTSYRAHRLAWLYVTGRWPKNQIDHGGGDGLNNRWSNLSDVTNRENHKNSPIPSHNTSGTIGVYFAKNIGKWNAQISTELGPKNLGYFADIEDAIAARKAAEVELGYHKNHGRV